MLYEVSGEIVSEQKTGRRSYTLAKVRLENGVIVSTDCSNRFRGEKVKVSALQGNVTGEIVYKCTEQQLGY